MSLQRNHEGKLETGRVLVLLALSCLVVSVGFTGTVAAETDPPQADFTADASSGPAPLTVTFTDVSSNSPTGWAWYFGDETYTAPWTRQTPIAEWTPRGGATSVVMPDGSIVLMGGAASGVQMNDVWRSTDNGKKWTQQTARAEWSPREDFSSVVMPDGSIVLMGGADSVIGFINDVWRSADNGKTWTQVTAHLMWMGAGHTSVVMPDGSIVLMGGSNQEDFSNKVWRSTDNGATWEQMPPGDRWSPRNGHTSVVMPDGSIVLMGGNDIDGLHKNDVWRSTDNGATWIQMNASAGWSPRWKATSVVMPDGSIVLMGGGTRSGTYYNDVWRSTDNGATWTQVIANAEWTAREGHTSVAVPDGGIVLMGGHNIQPPGIIARETSFTDGLLNDVWQIMPAGSSAQNPSHTYTQQGIYTVSLQAYNAAGYDSIQKIGYIDVAPPPNQPPVAAFTIVPDNPTVSDTISFTDSSVDPDGSIASYAWAFGDEETSSLQNPVHQYTAPGQYQVTHSATDDDGATGTAARTVIVDVEGTDSYVLDIPGMSISGAQLSIDTDVAGSIVSTLGSRVTIDYNGLVITIGTSGFTMENGVISGEITSINVESDTINADLPDLGSVHASFGAAMNTLPSDGGIESVLAGSITSDVQHAFELAAMQDKATIDGIAYVMEITRTGLADGTDIGTATIRMSVSQDWVARYGGPEKIRIIRFTEGGLTEILHPTHTIDDTGQYVFEAVSPNGLSVFGMVAMTFENSPPILDPIGARSTDEGVLLTFTVSAVDPDGDLLSFTTSNLPAGAGFDTVTETFTWTPGWDQAGTYEVTFTVSDGDLTDSEEVTITVTESSPALIDIKPGSCPNTFNRKEGGLVPIALVGRSDFDTSQVDPRSVTIEGISPVRWAFEDAATPFTGDLCGCTRRTHETHDGIPDILFHFDQEQIAGIPAVMNSEKGMTTALTLKGSFRDGTTFRGADCIVISR